MGAGASVPVAGAPVAGAAGEAVLAPQPTPSGAPLGRQGSGMAATFDLLAEVHGLQQQLAEVSASPVLGLAQAVELLAGDLATDLVAIYAVSPDDPSCLILFSAFGRGASALEGRPVVHGAGGAACARLSAPDLADPVAWRQLPHHLRALSFFARSLVSVPVGAPGAPLGCLVFAGGAPRAFEGACWEMRLQVAAMGVLRLLRQQQVEQLCGIVRAMDAAGDPLAVVSTLLRAAPRFMAAASNMRMAVRFALVSGGAAPPLLLGAEPSEALLFEVPRARRASLDVFLPAAAGLGSGGNSGVLSNSSCALPAPAGGRGGGAVLPGDAEAGVVATRLALHNTLLASAIRHQQARFVRECSVYMQACPYPARDVFSRSSELVASVVVLPLLARAPPDGDGGGCGGDSGSCCSDGGGAPAPLGGIYFALDTQCDFDNLRDTLLGFVHVVSLVLNQKLAGQAGLLAGEIAKAAERRLCNGHSLAASPRTSADVCALGKPPGTPPMAEPPSARESGSASGAGDDSSGPIPPPSSRLSQSGCCAALNTEAMLQVLQQEVRKGWRRTLNAGGLTELVVAERLGAGGFGTVFRGSWHKNAAAIKVMSLHTKEHQAVSDAMEMAVLSSVQHPNIVQVYACLTDMVEVADPDAPADGGAARPSRRRYRRLASDESPSDDGEVRNIMVMELCDQGALRDALRQGRFHARLPDGAVGVHLAAGLEVLLEVAYAVDYLHSMSLVHGDIKADNVLLKSDPSRTLGFTPKLSDFGTSKILDASEAAVNVTGSGTVTHLAPEMFQAGSSVTTAVDAYAFGVLMWELYTAGRPYSTMPAGAIAERVYRCGLRPHFPRATPPDYQSLAADCWQTEPAARPAFPEIIARLEALLAALAPPGGGGGGGCP